MSKRVFDLFCSGVGLVFLFPAFLLIMLWIKFDSPGPVFSGKYVLAVLVSHFVFINFGLCELMLSSPVA